MKILSALLAYNDISEKWNSSEKNSSAARKLTAEQISGFEEIVKSNDGWEYLLKIFNKGRSTDAWLALDWPDGFDELLLCVPLCSLVQFECGKCHVGMRQDNNSCANDFSLFGYTAELIKNNDRAGLIAHIKNMKEVLLNENVLWNIAERKTEISQTYFPAANPDDQAH